MSKLEKALDTLNSLDGVVAADITHPNVADVRCAVTVTAVYLVVMLSVPLQMLDMLIWFALYPIVACAIAGLSFAGIFLQSLVVLPFVALIGIFNPVMNTEEAFSVYGVSVSRGWVEYISIIVRCLMSVQATLLLVKAYGFPKVCRGLRKMGVPGFMTTQLLMVYRYIKVLMSEALTMRRAREARGYGSKGLPLRQWGEFVGQLFLRSIDRSARIDRAMRSRGFTGSMPDMSALYGLRWRWRDTVEAAVWIALFIVMRAVNLSLLFTHLIPQTS